MNPCLRSPALRGLMIFLVMSFAGCASLPENRGTASVDTLLAERGIKAPSWPKDASASTPLPAEPLSMSRAVEMAFARNPEVRGAYAELGIAEADVLEARQVFDISLGFSNMGVEGFPGEKVTRSIAMSFADLLMMPARSKLARTEYDRQHAEVAERLLALAVQVKSTWLEYVSSQQIARLAEARADLGETAGELATRLHAAGNLPAMEQAEALAHARAARVEALRSGAAARKARAELATLLGARSDEAWSTEEALPGLPATEPAMTGLVEQALNARLDLAAARTSLTAREQALGTARGWRWLGDVEVGYEKEKEPGGVKLSGPTLQLGIPLFHWNRAGVLRAEAELEAARAVHASLELEVRNAVALAIGNLATARDVAAHQQAALPLRGQVVQGTLENYNFMLADAFALLESKHEQLASVADFLESVTDYWRARSELEIATGGALPLAAAGEPLEWSRLLEGSEEPTTDPHAGHHGHGGGGK